MLVFALCFVERLRYVLTLYFCFFFFFFKRFSRQTLSRMFCTFREDALFSNDIFALHFDRQRGPLLTFRCAFRYLWNETRTWLVARVYLLFAFSRGISLHLQYAMYNIPQSLSNYFSKPLFSKTPIRISFKETQSEVCLNSLGNLQFFYASSGITNPHKKYIYMHITCNNTYIHTIFTYTYIYILLFSRNWN